jgi:hypothetical protein
MKTLTKIPIPSFPVALILALTSITGLSPKAQAVSPAPDGCYPGFTTAEGCNALSLLTTGAGNTGLGWYSLFSAGASNYNTGVGAGTLVLNTADSNTAVGAAALLLNTSGTENTAVGTDALGSNTTGFGNVAVGSAAGRDLTTGNGNICIGNFVVGHAAEDGFIRIGNNFAQASGSDSKTFIDGIIGHNVGAFGATVSVNSIGQLGTVISSARFKKDVDPMGKTSEVLFSLRPVTFHYKGDESNLPCFGLIAEEVAKVNPDLILKDKEGKPFTVRYEQINAMLLNEFLKEHRKVQEQDVTIADQKRDYQVKIDKLEATVAQQQKGMENLAAQLKEQAAQIQQVSAQLELRKAPAGIVANNQ